MNRTERRAAARRLVHREPGMNGEQVREVRSKVSKSLKNDENEAEETATKEETALD